MFAKRTVRLTSWHSFSRCVYFTTFTCEGDREQTTSVVTLILSDRRIQDGNMSRADVTEKMLHMFSLWQCSVSLCFFVLFPTKILKGRSHRPTVVKKWDFFVLYGDNSDKVIYSFLSERLFLDVRAEATGATDTKAAGEREREWTDENENVERHYKVEGRADHKDDVGDVVSEVIECRRRSRGLRGISLPDIFESRLHKDIQALLA